MSKEPSARLSNSNEKTLCSLKRLSDEFSLHYQAKETKSEQDTNNEKRKKEQLEDAAACSPSLSTFMLGAVMRHVFASHVCGLNQVPAHKGDDVTTPPLLLGMDIESLPILHELFPSDEKENGQASEHPTAAVMSYIGLVAKVIRSTEALSPVAADTTAASAARQSLADETGKAHSAAVAAAARRSALMQQEEELLRCLYIKEVYPYLALEERKNITHLIPLPAQAHQRDLEEATLYLADVLLYFVLLHATSEKRDGLPNSFLLCLRGHLQQRVVSSNFLAYSTVWWVLCSRLRLAHVHSRRSSRAAPATPSVCSGLPTARARFQNRADYVIKSFFRLRSKQSLVEEKNQLARLLEKQTDPVAGPAATAAAAREERVALSGNTLEELLSELVECVAARYLSAATTANEDAAAPAPAAALTLHLPPLEEQQALAFASVLRACHPPAAPPSAPKSKGFLLCRMISPSLESSHSLNTVVRHCFSGEGAGGVASVVVPVSQGPATAPPATSVSLSTSANPFRFRRDSDFFTQSVQAAQTWCGVPDTIYFALLALTNAPDTPASRLAQLFIALEDTISLVSRGQCLATHARDAHQTQPQHEHQQRPAHWFSDGGGEVSEPAQPSLPLDMLLGADDARQVYSPYVLETLDLLCYFIEVGNEKHVGLVEEAKQCVLHHAEMKLQSAML